MKRSVSSTQPKPLPCLQLYLAFPEESKSGEPPKVLRAFTKTGVIQPGASETVRLSLSVRDFSIWDTVAASWKLVHGSFEVMVAASAVDIRLKKTLKV